MANDYLKKFAPVATHLSSPTSATKSAQSGHHDRTQRCPLSGVKRTSSGRATMSVSDPKQTWGTLSVIIIGNSAFQPGKLTR